MKAQVEVPQPLPLDATDAFTVLLRGAGYATIVVHGDGRVEWHGNGNGAPVFTVDLAATAAGLAGQVAGSLGGQT